MGTKIQKQNGIHLLIIFCQFFETNTHPYRKTYDLLNSTTLLHQNLREKFSNKVASLLKIRY